MRQQSTYLYFGCLPIVIIVILCLRACSQRGEEFAAVTPPAAAPVAPAPAEPIPPRQPEVRVLDFYATWCAPCRAAAPRIAALEQAGHRISRIDVDQQRSMARIYKVTSIPTFIVLTDGIETFRTHDVRALEARLKSQP